MDKDEKNIKYFGHFHGSPHKFTEQLFFFKMLNFIDSQCTDENTSEKK